MIDAPLTVDRFRDMASADHARDATQGWLPQWVAHQMPLESRPAPLWSLDGRVFHDFPSALVTVLRIYKPHKHRAFRDVGWRPDPAVTRLVATQIATVVADALREDCDAAIAEWLTRFDPALLGEYTAVDHRFQTITDQPVRMVLDFGAGIGRQAWPWLECGATVISVDAIETCYMVQHEVFRRLVPDALTEYGTNPERCERILRSADSAVVHLPTWQLGVVQDRSVDLVIAVHVLQELSTATLRNTITTFTRVVRRGGLLYIRDDEFWMPAHRLRVGRLLLAQGWRLIFRYPGDNGTEIAGLPRVWMFTGDNPDRHFRWQARVKRVVLPSYKQSFRSWRDLGLPI